MLSRKNIIIFMVLTIFVILSQSLAAQTVLVSNKKFTTVRDTILKAVTAGDIPSMSVAVAKDGKIILEESFGWANREKMIKATPHTMYSMASVSKPMAATGLMTLVEKGMVDLNETVNKYIVPSKLTAYEGNTDEVTVRHILNHTAGLATHYTVFYLDEPDRQPPDITESIRRYGVLVFPPGKVYQYANFGFRLVDHIISKVSGRSFADFMKKEVFLPLGMTHSCIDIEPGFEEFAAERYDGMGNPVPFYISDHPGASQVYSSAHDVVRFGMFHLKNHLKDQKKILKDETLDLMHTDSDPDPENNRYGLGWFLRDDEYGYDVVWHTGSMRGVNNIIKMVPSENIVVVVLVNTGTPLRVKVCNDILSVLLPDYGKKWQTERDKQREPRGPFEPDEKLIGKWIGELRTYEETVPVTFEFQEDGDIHVKITGQMETLVNHPRFEDGFLTGRSYGTIPSGDAMMFPHSIYYRLRLNENKLSGYVMTSFETERSYGTFSSYIFIEKE